MPKAKSKAAKPELTGDGPTPERMTRDEWQTITAPKLQAEDWRTRTGKARRVVCRIDRMRQDGWLNADETRALIAYQGLIEQAGYDAGRSCIDFSPKGNGAGLPHHVTVARDRLAALDFALSFEIGRDGVAFVQAVLGPYGMETIGDVAERWRQGFGRQARMNWARDVFKLAGATLAEIG